MNEIEKLKYENAQLKQEIKNLIDSNKALKDEIFYLLNRKKKKIKQVHPNWKLFNFESEMEYFQCVNNCDYHNNDVAINDKRIPACGSLRKAENCIIWIYTQKLKTRIEIERQETSPSFHCQRSGKGKGCKLNFGINEDLEEK